MKCTYTYQSGEHTYVHTNQQHLLVLLNIIGVCYTSHELVTKCGLCADRVNALTGKCIQLGYVCSRLHCVISC